MGAAFTDLSGSLVHLPSWTTLNNSDIFLGCKWKPMTPQGFTLTARIKSKFLKEHALPSLFVSESAYPPFQAHLSQASIYSPTCLPCRQFLENVQMSCPTPSLCPPSLGKCLPWPCHPPSFFSPVWWPTIGQASVLCSCHPFWVISTPQPSPKASDPLTYSVLISQNQQNCVYLSLIWNNIIKNI